MNRYPSEPELEYIKNFDMLKSPARVLMEYVESIWQYGDWGYKRTYHTWQLHTGGWSGNEDIVSALHCNHLFWSLTFASMRSGGHYYFSDSLLRGLKPSRRHFLLAKGKRNDLSRT